MAQQAALGRTAYGGIETDVLRDADGLFCIA